MDYAVSLPVSRPLGRTLVVGGPSARPPVVALLQNLGYAAAEADDPYTAVLELCRRPGVYQSVILGLATLYREELAVITTVKQRFPRVEVWLAQTDGRPAAMAEALRLGADGLLADDGLHRLAASAAEPVAAVAAPPPSPRPVIAEVNDDPHGVEPVLTAEELRALLQEMPTP